MSPREHTTVRVLCPIGDALLMDTEIVKLVQLGLTRCFEKAPVFRLVQFCNPWRLLRETMESVLLALARHRLVVPILDTIMFGGGQLRLFSVSGRAKF